MSCFKLSAFTKRKMGYLVVLFVAVLAAFGRPAACSDTPGFACKSPISHCRAMVGFVPENKTTINAVKKLFGITDIGNLLAANGLPASTPETQSVNPSQALKIPFNCSCSASAGVVSNPPTYTVKSGDILDNIASKVFSHLVTYQQIAAYNNISNPNLITVGEKLSIPLPCSCDQIAGVYVLHYGHVVAAGSSIPAIAKQFNVSEDIVMSLNNIANASLLQANQLLDIPLPVCSSKVIKDSLDYPMLVPDGTYFYTANDCVNCSCNMERNFELQCSRSSVQNLTCPLMDCGTTSLGTTTNSSGCINTCSYRGFEGGAIMNQLEFSCLAAKTGAAPAKFNSWKLSLIPIFAVLSAYIL